MTGKEHERSALFCSPLLWHVQLRPRVREFFFFENCLTGAIPDAVFFMSRMGFFEVAWNRLIGTFPGLLARWESLDVSFNALAGALPSNEWLTRAIVADENRLTGSPVSEAQNLRCPQHVCLQYDVNPMLRTNQGIVVIWVSLNLSPGDRRRGVLGCCLAPPSCR